MKPPQNIYLDYAAATPMDEAVVRAMLPYYTECFYNPSSPYAPAVAVRHEYQAAKATLADAVGARSDEIIMTAGASESITLACSAAGDGEIITSAIEHPAVLRAAARRKYTVVAPTARGYSTAEMVAAHITPDTQLISIGYANNELGTVQPLKEIAQLIAKERERRRLAGETRPLWLHTDASQAAGVLDLHVGRLGVDLMTLNASKCYGPKQTGLLWARPRVTLEPIVVGGGQEFGLRGGTESVAGTVGFAAALSIAERKRPSETKRLSTLRQAMQQMLTERVPQAIINSQTRRALPGLLHISFPGIDAERLVFALENEGIYVATGSACSANKGTASHVLVAVGMDPALIAGSMRISLGRPTTQEQAKQAIEAICGAVLAEYKRLNREA